MKHLRAVVNRLNKRIYRHFAGILPVLLPGILRRMGKPPKLPPEKFDIRLPAGLRDRLAEQAKKEHRSSNAQVVHYIESGLSGADNTTIMAAIERIEAAISDLRKMLTDKQQ